MRVGHEEKWYSADCGEAGFLLGGIGTGTITLGSRGQLKDWEIFNQPGKGNEAYYAGFFLHVHGGGQRITRLLEARHRPPHTQTHGYHSGRMAGLPRFTGARLSGEYPFARVELKDESLPVSASLEAFTPFIPLEADDSGIPAALFRYRVKNTSGVEQQVSIAASLPNLVGYGGLDAFDNLILAAPGRNTWREQDGVRGIFMDAPDLPETHLKHGSMALMTPATDVSHKATWRVGGWWDGVQDFYDEFSASGRLCEVAAQPDEGSTISPQALLRVGSICIQATLQPGESAEYPFLIAWHFPNRPRNWFEDRVQSGDALERNHYANRFADAWSAGAYFLNNLARLEGDSRKFHDALFQSTLPDAVIDAASATLTALRSNTCFRISDGSFLAFEGCHDHSGSCEGTCTHVWNYAQSVAWLFPELERSARNIEFGLETEPDGRMNFRTWGVFGLPKLDLPAAADGQLGTVIRAYREWKLSGDEAFLRKNRDAIRRALDYALKHWDLDGDGVLDGCQHNTYDIEFYGPTSMLNSLLYAALKAAAEMERHLGDAEQAGIYDGLRERGSARMDALLWNGEYYRQLIEDVDAHKYQYGEGCLSDQLFGQTLAHLTGLGYILPEEHVRHAIKAVYDHNFVCDVADHSNVQRGYAVAGEPGLLLCSWPRGGRPKQPFVYSDEVWSGIEYQVAAHLVYEGFVEQAMDIVSAVRQRHDGVNRSPWNEEECGHHYARSMASWAVLLALSGCHADLVKGEMRFDPAINASDFRTFWSHAKGWGTYHQWWDEAAGEYRFKLEVLHGTNDGVRVICASAAPSKENRHE